MKAIFNYRKWTPGRIYNAQSKTKLYKMVMQDWSYWPCGDCKIEKWRNDKLIALI